MRLRPPRIRVALYRVARGLLSRHTRDDLLQLLTTLAMSPLYVVPVVLFALGAALTPLLLLGLPLVPLAMKVASWIARIDRERLYVLRDFTIDTPVVIAGKGWKDRLERLFGQRAWRELGFTAVMSLWGLGAGGLVMMVLAAGLVLALLPFIGPLLPDGSSLLGLDVASLPGAAAGGVVGLALLSAGLWLGGPLARTESALVARMLGANRVDHLVRRMLDLEDSRSRMVDAAELERQRIERDLHDGAQQRLLSVAMSLGRAKSRFARDPEKAHALVMAAHEEAKAAMQELRDVTRGLHPAILTEQGIEPALTTIAARCPIPVDLSVQLLQRPSPRAEAVAYYVVSELLTNIAKHAAADHAAVTVLRDENLLRINVTDDGIGGADPARGSGISGLRDRVRAVDGHLTLSSPVGGPTVVDVTLPWRA
ncbi:histidine kinase [Streptomyces sp. G3]|uniref:sensor histidine kinase n=1 Tax=unclassified Streptomyces TaxID=2593676 RepID=UPI00106EF6F8|nr:MULTISPECIES: histidine kinase [unclassified Streptomyces]MCM1940675.1 histidine kinase [Streptomyces sp. G3]NDZ70367.1 sensor histidine kinase [Streptomyces sp. SID10362]QUW95302.1 Oxygen sensor histidine kinase NreB [Streptomyces sp. V17-9]WKX17238.1 histidine kinase [Streptomyces sp. HUAS CX7]